MEARVEYTYYPILVDTFHHDHIVILCSNMLQPIQIAWASTLYSETYDNYDIIDTLLTNFLPEGRNIICLCSVRSDQETLGDAVLLKCGWEIPNQELVKTLYVNEEVNSESWGVVLKILDKRQPQSLIYLSAGYVQTEDSYQIQHWPEWSRDQIFQVGRKYDAKWIVDGEMRSTCTCNRWSEWIGNHYDMLSLAYDRYINIACINA